MLVIKLARVYYSPFDRKIDLISLHLFYFATIRLHAAAFLSFSFTYSDVFNLRTQFIS